jgi:hypothetical protein
MKKAAARGQDPEHVLRPVGQTGMPTVSGAPRSLDCLIQATCIIRCSAQDASKRPVWGMFTSNIRSVSTMTRGVMFLSPVNDLRF